MPIGHAADVDAYIASVPEPFRAALKRLRAQVRSAAPQAQEGIGYGLPGFYLDGPLLYYGAAKAHCAIYGSMPAARAALAKELAGFVQSKGTIRFTPDRPLSPSLVRRLVKARVAENKARAAAKKKSKARPKERTKR